LEMLSSLSWMVDPTLAYVLLVMGIWVGATAVLLPGTGVAEVIALLALGVSAWMLSQLSVHWLGFVVLVSGVMGFVVFPFMMPRFARWAELGLVFQLIGGLYLYIHPMNHVWVVLVMVGLAFVYNRFFLVPLMRRMQRYPQVGNDAQQLLGAVGSVTLPIVPPQRGVAQLNGELWSVKCEVAVERGASVRVVAVNGLDVRVEPIETQYS
jgi:membrane-bound serine protease (ClpP class)